MPYEDMKDQFSAYSAHAVKRRVGEYSALSESAVVFENRDERPHTETMSTITREELDAKLELIESKLDAKVQRIEDKIDLFAKASDENQAAVKSLKSTVIATGISTVLAIVLGVAAFNATVLSNMVASFESGKNTAQSLSQTQEELRKREQRLIDIEQKLDKLAAGQQKK